MEILKALTNYDYAIDFICFESASVWLEYSITSIIYMTVVFLRNEIEVCP